MDTTLIAQALDQNPEVAVFLDSLLESGEYWYEVSEHREIRGFLRVALYRGEEWELPVETWTVGPDYLSCVSNHWMPLWQQGERVAWNDPRRIPAKGWW